ncbi:MAG: Gfo/Idh/MocA family oxidoreductase [Deltaproteobacteria bacterium]|nr:Gfo/Idh/MocA family oxidoreductase [Deltaproteobacteria bacterium]
MKVSIIGAGRNNNGIGEYIAKFFHKNKATVISVLGTTTKTARHAAARLKRYGIQASAYTDFYHMIEEERPDSVVIASPLPTHFEYLIKSVDASLNVFCEKPFIWNKNDNQQKLIDFIFQKAEGRNLKIAMNSQWPFSMPYYETLCGSIDRKKADTFFMHLSPMVAGKEMILDSVPHALSILYFALGKGKIIKTDIESYEKIIIIRFIYNTNSNDCEVLIRLEREERQPRSFKFGFNDKIVYRVLDLKDYDIYFKYFDRTLKVPDPLELSVKDFISSVKTKREPQIGKSHIIATDYMLKIIYNCYENF